MESIKYKKYNYGVFGYVKPGFERVLEKFQSFYKDKQDERS